MRKQFALVLMPFHDDFLNVYRYGIRAAFEDVRDRVYCQRVDEQEYDGLVIDRIYNQIQCADYLVADMTGLNANVFYEVGYAHALQKKVILLAQSHADIPFDLNQYPHIYYNKNDLDKLRDELKKRVDYYLSSSDALKSPEVELKAYLNQVPLEAYKKTTVAVNLLWGKPKSNSINVAPESGYCSFLKILLKNETSKVFDSVDTGISVFFSSNTPLWENPDRYKIVMLPDGKKLIPEFFWGSKIYPYSYWQNEIELHMIGPRPKAKQTIDTPHYGEIQINSPYAQQIYPFDLKLQLT